MVRWVEPLVFLSGVVMGTGSTLTVKIIYGLEAVGTTGDLQRFEKPLFVTWIMFLGMMLALPVYWIQRAIQKRNNIKDDGSPWRTYFLLVIPAAFDLFGTALSGVGLLFTTVSVYQLLRSSVIIVTALLKATVLKHKLEAYQWFGIFLNTVAMCFVAATSFFPGASTSGVEGGGENTNTMNDNNNRDPRIGILFILASCAVQGSQYVFEEKVMAVDNAHPLVVVGMEGVWGSLLMPLIVFPWAYILPGSDAGACVENFWDAIVMLRESSAIQIVLLAFTLTVFFYNIFCIYVTYLLNSIWHAILDNFRPVSVWGTDLLLFYVFTKQRFGEPWTLYSWLELAGMALLFVGTAVYNGSIKVPGFYYPAVLPLEADETELLEGDDNDDEDDFHHDHTHTTTAMIKQVHGMSSPLLSRSPLLNKSIAIDRRLSHEYAPLHFTTSINGSNNNNNNSYGTTDRTTNSGVHPSSRRTANQTSSILSSSH